MKLVILLFLFILSTSNFSFSQESNSEKPKAKKSTERDKKPKATTALSEDELRKELSGKYEGILEIPMCCNSYEYKYGSVYIDVTKDPITFIYSGIIYDNSDYYYENKKILAKQYAYSNNPIVGWFEKKFDNWIFWQRFDGTEEDYVTDKKPDFITKKSGIADCRAEINSYIEQEEVFKSYWSEFRSSIINSKINSLSSLIDFPLMDETSHREEAGFTREINDAGEFIRRMKLILEKAKTTADIYFIDQRYYKEMEANEYFGGMYSFSGMFNLVFDRINGNYKLVRFFGPVG